MSSSEHEHCLCGEIHTGKPKGHFEQIAGFRTYVASPAHAKKDKVVLYITDVFGLDFINNQLLADTYAEETGVPVYIPDFVENDPVPLNAFEVGFDFGKWLGVHNKDRVYPFCKNFVTELREKHGVTRIAATGYCWGALFGVELSKQAGLIDGVVSSHPSLLSIPDDIEAIATQSIWICADSDNQFDEAKRKATEEILKRRGVPNKFVFYPGTFHGFTVRGSETDAVVTKATKDAKDQTVKFFREVLHV